MVLEKIVLNNLLFDFINAKASDDFVPLVKKINFEEEFSLINKKIESQYVRHPILYLEFGVWEGESIKFASQTNLNPESRFIGFDSFEGLPEDWQSDTKKGTFSTNGTIPTIDDSRVRFVKGLFIDTLPFQVDAIHKIIQDNPNYQIFINMDADLFSSTLYVLSKLERIITKNVMIRFDEFGVLSENSEFLAFKSFIQAFNKSFEIVMADDWYRNVIVRIL